MKSAETVMRSPEISEAITRVTGLLPSESLYGVVLDVDQRVASEAYRYSALVEPGAYVRNFMSAFTPREDDEKRWDTDSNDFQVMANRRSRIERSLTGLGRIIPEALSITESRMQSGPTANALVHLANFSLRYAVDYEPKLVGNSTDFVGNLTRLFSRSQRRRLKL